MSSASITAIIGVVVGALLGGGAQILSSWLQHQRQRQDILDQERRTALVQVIALVGARDSVRHGKPDVDQQAIWGSDATAALGMVRLLCGYQTWDRARQALYSPDTPADELDTLSAFIDRARAELGRRQP